MPDPAADGEKLVAFEAQDDAVFFGTGIFFVGFDFLIFAPDAVFGVGGGVTVEVDFVFEDFVFAEAAEVSDDEFSKVVVSGEFEWCFCDFEVCHFAEGVASEGALDCVVAVEVPVAVVVDELVGADDSAF